jgi:hypothetical protein
MSVGVSVTNPGKTSAWQPGGIKCIWNAAKIEKSVTNLFQFFQNHFILKRQRTMS